MKCNKNFESKQNAWHIFFSNSRSNYFPAVRTSRGIPLSKKEKNDSHPSGKILFNLLWNANGQRSSEKKGVKIDYLHEVESSLVEPGNIERQRTSINQNLQRIVKPSSGSSQYKLINEIRSPFSARVACYHSTESGKMSPPRVDRKKVYLFEKVDFARKDGSPSGWRY